MTRASLIVENARIRTLDPTCPTASALAIADGLIVAVGDRHEVAEHRGPRTEVVDLAGAALVPGLVDSHLHPFYGAQRGRGVDFAGRRTLDEVRAALRQERRRCGEHLVQRPPPGEVDPSPALGAVER